MGAQSRRCRPMTDLRDVDESYLVALNLDTNQALVPLADYGLVCEELERMKTEPLIHTTKGNVPIASLAYSHRWEDTAEYTKFVETYRIGDEVVRESIHVMGKKALDVGVAQASL